jgi:hypothetical protein
MTEIHFEDPAHRSACDVAGQAVKAAKAHRTRMLAQVWEAELARDEACILAREAAETKGVPYWPADYQGGNIEYLDQAIDDLVTAQGAYYAAHNAHADAHNARVEAKLLAEEQV